MQLAIKHYEKLSLQGSNQAYVVANFLKENFLEMEKEQIINAHYEGSENYRRQYYNETFKSE